MKYLFIFLAVIGIINSAFSKTDFSVTLTSQASDTVCQNPGLKVEVKITNNGNSTVFNTPIQFYAKGDSGTILLKKDTIKYGIHPSGYVMFNWTFQPGKLGRYKIMAFHERTDDSISINDTVSLSVYVKSRIKGKLSQKVTDVCKGDSVFLKVITDATTVNWFDLRYPLTRPPVSKTKTYYFKPAGSITKITTLKFLIIGTDSAYGVCEFIDTATVNVHPIPIVDLGPDKIICNGSSVNLSYTCDDDCKYLWSTGDTTSKITVNKKGWYKLWVTVQVSGCKVMDSVFVDSLSPDLSAYTSGCEGDPIVFDGGYTATTYSWDFGDQTNSTYPKPSHTYVKPGQFTITLKITKGTCTTQVSQVLNVYPKTKADFSINGQCAGAPIIFKAEPDSGQATGFKYEWKFGDGFTDTSAEVSHIYMLGGNYPISLTVINNHGCKFSVSEFHTVLYPPDVDFTISGDTLTVTGSGFNYEWYLNNAKINNATGASHIAKSTGIYKASYENAYGCRGFSIGKYVEVKDTSSGINEFAHESVSVYPNPGKGVFLVEWQDQRPDKIVVSDILGRILVTQLIEPGVSFFSLDLKEHATGFYLVRLEQGSNVVQTRIMKL